MVTEIDEQIQVKILAEYSEAEIELVRQERCVHCKHGHLVTGACRLALLPVTTRGDMCPYYMP